MAAAPISYGNDYSADQASIERARQYAALMQQQSLETPQTQVVGGWAIPNGKMTGVAKLAQALGGAVGNYAADKRQKELVDKQKTDLTNTLTDAQSALMGSPAKNTQPATPVDDEGNQMPSISSPAVAGDAAKYASILMQNPQTMQLGMAASQKNMENLNRQRALADALGGASIGGQPGQQGQQGSAGQSGSSGNALGIPDKIAKLMMSGDPELVALGKSILESSKGIAQRPGAPVVNPFTGQVIAQPTPSVPAGIQLNVGPNGNQASLIPGAQQAMGSLTQTQAGAAAAGKLPYEPPTVVNTQGSPTLMTIPQQIQAATGAPPPNPLAPQGQPTAPMPQQAQQMPQRGMQPPQTAQPGLGMAGGPGASNRAGDRVLILQDQLAQEQARVPKDATDAARKVSDIAALQRELGSVAPAPIERGPGGLGMKLQDQGESAQQVAGGKTLAQLQYEAPQARAAVADTVSNLNRLREQANQILNDKSLGGITGIQGMFPNMPGGHAADIQARLNTLKSQVGFGALQAMRAASKTGGALGSVSDSENDLLQRNIAALDKVQSLDGMKESLRKIIEYADGASQRMSRAYEDQYSRVQGTQGMKITPSGAMPANTSQGNIGWSIKRVGG